MVLVDTSIWIDHLRKGVVELAEMLRRNEVLCHPWVVGELALGSLANRDEIVHLLRELPQATVASELEVMALIDRHKLFGLGIGYVDAHLIGATFLTADAALWTRDKRLANAAADLHIEYQRA